MNDPASPIVENSAPPGPPEPSRIRGPRRVIDWIVIAWIAWALVGLLWTPYDPQAQIDRAPQAGGISAAHWLGVDDIGRDVLSRVWRGSGNTIVLGAMAAAGTMFFAALLLVLERRGPRVLRRLVRAL